MSARTIQLQQPAHRAAERQRYLATMFHHISNGLAMDEAALNVAKPGSTADEVQLVEAALAAVRECHKRINSLRSQLQPGQLPTDTGHQPPRH